MERAHTQKWYGSYTPKVVKLLGTHLLTLVWWMFNASTRTVIECHDDRVLLSYLHEGYEVRSVNCSRVSALPDEFKRTKQLPSSLVKTKLNGRLR